MVNRYRPVMGHNAKQLPLLGSLPAPYARANRSGHRNRLTWQTVRSIPNHVCVPAQSGYGSVSCRSCRVCRLKAAHEC